MLQFLKRALAALIKARQAEADRRIAMTQLGRMSDRELNDIGIGRRYSESSIRRCPRRKRVHQQRSQSQRVQ